MILGMTTSTFTLLHVIISLVGIGSGAIVLVAMILDRKFDLWIGGFLATTVLTSATGFLFPFTSFGPPDVVGIVSLFVLAATLFALYARHLHGRWRPVFVVGATVAFYLNVFVAVAQAFQKIPGLRALAPTQTEPPFAIAQGVVLLAFIALGYLAVRRFRSA